MTGEHTAIDLGKAYDAVTLGPLQSGDPRYVDCSPARGYDGDIVSTLSWRIDSSKSPMTQLISGHRGCGKSTELLRLAKNLEDKKFLVVYFAADEDLDIGDLEYTDLLVAIIKRLERDLAEKGIQIDPRLMKGILMWFAEVVYESSDEEQITRTLDTEFELGLKAPSALPIIAKMLAKITGQIRTGQKSRKNIRSKLDPQVYQLIARINEFIAAAIPEIKKKGFRDIVLIIDNLDRIVLRMLDAETGRTTHDALYLEHAEQLKALDAYMIYTVPISMFYSLKVTQLTGAFPSNAILPMIKVQEKNGAPCELGRNLLYQVAKERIDVQNLFNKDVVEFLAEKSGGVLRDFVRLLAYTIEIAQANGGRIPIDKTIAERAFHRLVNEYGRVVPEKNLSLLANVAKSKKVLNDADHQAMLYNLIVLEYMNGDRWCDVHPAVRDLSDFQDALNNLSKIAKRDPISG
jgi:hypothetical protein